MSTEQPLLILALSGRALAQSAARGGWTPTVVDGFADRDTRRVARCRRVARDEMGLCPAALAQAVRERLRRGARRSVVYGSGLERSATLLSYCQEHAELLGNEPATMQAAHDPETFFALLDTLRVPHPAVRLSAPTGGDWLVKGAQGCGGGHVRHWCRGAATPERPYWQRRAAGQAGSVLFLADGSQARVLGWNTLWQRGPDCHLYAGAVNRLRLPAAGRRTVEHAVAALTRELGLVGLNSLDFVVTAGGPRVLELNPRPSATMELYDSSYRQGLLALHIAACRGEVHLDHVNANNGGPVRAHLVVYAPSTVAAADTVSWPRWCSDIPAGAQVTAAGAPLCTVRAAGSDVSRVTALARARGAAVLRRVERPFLAGAVA